MTEKLLRKLQKQADFQDTLDALVSNDVTFIILTRDVMSLVASPLLNGKKIIFPKFCLYRYENAISVRDFQEVFQTTNTTPEESVFLSSDKKDFVVAANVGIEKNIFFSTYQAIVRKKPYETIDRAENLIEALTTY